MKPKKINKATINNKDIVLNSDPRASMQKAEDVRES
jgi:hypothetical protein